MQFAGVLDAFCLPEQGSCLDGVQRSFLVSRTTKGRNALTKRLEIGSGEHISCAFTSLISCHSETMRNHQSRVQDPLDRHLGARGRHSGTWFCIFGEAHEITACSLATKATYFASILLVFDRSTPDIQHDPQSCSKNALEVIGLAFNTISLRMKQSSWSEYCI